ncbi:zinc-ribbon domain-containing protein [Cypionkella aquatica]|nr:zinc-ribbon domain-containing protein [Cypionkella aquatica]
MRLICPNCDAEYEVDAGAIPDSGRDVQCSNCGHAWFQMAPEVEAEIAAEQALFDAPPSVGGAPLATSVGVAPVAAQMQAAPPASEQPAATADLTEAAAKADTAPPAPAYAPRSIDESVLAVLREEAEREVEARKIEAPAVETQSEMGLEQPATAGVARRLARLNGAPEPAIKPQTRREMLPEIEEINSTLRASSERRAGSSSAIAEPLDDDAGKKSSFRSGFALTLVIAVALLAAYVMAPKLAQQFPAAAGTLNAFVAAVDAGRVAVDGLLKSAIAFLKGLAGGSA